MPVGGNPILNPRPLCGVVIIIYLAADRLRQDVGNIIGNVHRLVDKEKIALRTLRLGVFVV